MHADVTPDGTVTVVIGPGEDRQVAVEAAAAVIVALDAWRAGDEDTANTTLRHAVHSGVPPMELLLAGAHAAVEVDAVMAPAVHVTTIPQAGGVVRLSL